MVPPPSGELDIDALLETARKDPAYRDLSSEELFLQVTQKLYSALKADKERAASGETRPAESNIGKRRATDEMRTAAKLLRNSAAGMSVKIFVRTY